MASVFQRGNSWKCVYNHRGPDGKKKQVWETFLTEEEAQKRSIEVDYLMQKGTFVPPNPLTISGLLEEYVKLYGRNYWSHSTYSCNMGLINNYINPSLGSLRLRDATAFRMDLFFNELRKQKAAAKVGQGEPDLITDRTIYDIHSLLKCAFNKAVGWELVGKNPVTDTSRPRIIKRTRSIWEPDDVKKALAMCNDVNLKVCIHLAIACSMRIGEILGLQWSNITLGTAEDSYRNSKLQIDSQLQRVSKESFTALSQENNRVKFVFPNAKKGGSSVLILKSPKTTSSIRTIWIPPTVSFLLSELRQKQLDTQALLGSENYDDFDLVIAQNNGRPIEVRLIDGAFAKFISKAKLPKVDFHSLRHTSTSIKLVITNGDIKNVQADTGHSQAKMVTDTYGHVFTSKREDMALLFEQAFYSDSQLLNSQSISQKPVERVDPELLSLLSQLSNNPNAMLQLKELLHSTSD